MKDSSVSFRDLCEPPKLRQNRIRSQNRNFKKFSKRSQNRSRKKNGTPQVTNCKAYLIDKEKFKFNLFETFYLIFNISVYSRTILSNQI